MHPKNETCILSLGPQKKGSGEEWKALTGRFILFMFVIAIISVAVSTQLIPVVEESKDSSSPPRAIAKGKEEDLSSSPFIIIRVSEVLAENSFSNSNSPDETGKVFGYINASSGLKLRAEPSLSARELEVIPYRMKVEILKEGEEWSQVKFGATVGWVANKYLTFAEVKSESKSKSEGINNYIWFFILVAVPVLNYLKNRRKQRKLTREWLLNIVPELQEGNLEVPRDLVKATLLVYRQHFEFGKRVEKLAPGKTTVQKKIEQCQQRIEKHRQAISAIKKIGKAEKLDVDSAPKIRYLEEKIREEGKVIDRWTSKLSHILDLERNYKQAQSVAEVEARSIVAKWVAGLGGKLNDSVKRKIETEIKKRNEVKSLISETKSIIESALEDAKDPARLSALMILQQEVSNLAEKFENDGLSLSYEEIKRLLLERKGDAEVLSQGVGGESQETYYDILEVSPDADEENIKKAYYKKIKEYHPDKIIDQHEWIKKEANEMSRKINEAYDILKDPGKRKKYDRENKIS